MGLLRNALVAAVGTLRIFAVARADEWNGLRSSLSSAGDIDGDGVPDLMVASRDSTRSGVVWILSGRNGALLRTLEGARPCDGFGSSMALVGDLDGDGSPDMVVGARGMDCDHGPHEEECVPYARAYSGKDGHILYEIRTGWIVGAAGDITGDGTTELLVGDPNHLWDVPADVFVYSGRLGCVLDRLQPPKGAEHACWFGSSFASVGDIDEDGAADFAVGSSDEWSETSKGRGSVALYSGKQRVLLAHVEGDRDAGLGWSLAGIDDVDGDGHPDLLVGAIHRYVDVLSGTDLHRIRRIKSKGGYDICDAFASSLDVLGDVDMDCVPDWIVGANEDVMVFDWGYAQVVSGRTGRVLGDVYESSDEGVDACGIGDIDLDGVPDIALATETKCEDQGSGYPVNKKEPVKQTRRIQVISGRTWKRLWQVDAASLRK